MTRIPREGVLWRRKRRPRLRVLAGLLVQCLEGRWATRAERRLSSDSKERRYTPRLRVDRDCSRSSFSSVLHNVPGQLPLTGIVEEKI